ncbi:MAG: hypothetical protein AB2L13_19410 [Spirochaetota bacterium]
MVINFLNERNEADRRVLELLAEKFSLFSGVFGASDEVLGAIESGVDFEKRILAIYQECRTPEEIEAAFRILQDEMDELIRTRMDDTRRLLFERFDEDVHERLRMKLADAKAQLDRFGRRFWWLTRHILDDRARFDETALAFDLDRPPVESIPAGRYHLISKSLSQTEDGADRGAFLYRLSHPLGEYVVDSAKRLDTPHARLVFDISNHPTRLSVIEALRGTRGALTLTRLVIDSYEREEYLLLSGIDETGASLDQETMEKLFACTARVENGVSLAETDLRRLEAESERHVQATISRSLDQNSRYFNQAREKLEKWADDMILSAEKALLDTKTRIKALRREARQAATLLEQHEIQLKLQKLEQQQRRQRQEIFKAEDEINEKRDRLIDALERRMAQRIRTETLFTINWSVE